VSVKRNIGRRNFIAFTSMGVIGSLAGCSGTGDQSPATSATAQTQSEEGNDSSGEITDAKYADGKLVVELEEDSTANRINYMIGEEQPSNVPVKDRTTVPVLDVGELDLIGAIGKTVQLEAVRDVEADDEVVGEAEIPYDPDVTVSAVELLFETGDLAVEIKNQGTGPLEIRPYTTFPDPAQLKPDNEEFATSISPLSYPRLNTGLNGVVDKAILGSDETIRISSEETDTTPLKSEVTYTERDEGRYNSITVDKTGNTAVLEVELDPSPSELTSAFEVEMEFTDIEAELERESTDFDYYEYDITYQIGDGETVSISPRD